MVMQPKCCGCCDSSIAYHFIGIWACIEVFGALIYVCFGDLEFLVSFFLALFLAIAYFRGTCGQDMLVRL